ncbi:peptidase S24/S26A/S26B/S26C [Aspergillus venezuelensis]
MPQQPKYRVLTPEAAHARSTRSSQPLSSPSETPAQPSQPSASKPNTPRPRFSPLSYLRTRYASLPRPLRLSLHTLGVLAPILPIGLFFSQHIAQILWVNGPSMTPYLNADYETMHTNRDVVLVNMWPFGGAGWGLPWRENKRRIERGMVVLFRSPGNPNHVAIKRVIGLPGDRITTRKPCLKDSQIVPFNHVWVEGDAEDARKSLDSNTYGPVSVSLISGRVVAVLWPRFRWVEWKGWESGKVDGIEEGGYREEVRDRVGKEAVKVEKPSL